MLSRQELTLSEQVTPIPNKPITTTASPNGGGTSRDTFISRLKTKYHTAKIILENEWPNNTDRKERLSPRKDGSPLTCFGTNIRSMVAPANAYSLNKFLEDHKPDILFLVETWHREGHQISLPDRGYGVILSPLDDLRAGGVGIVFRKPLIVTPLFQEFHTRNLVIARLSSSQGEPIILMSVYIPPDHQRRQGAVSHLCRVIEFMRQKYSTFSLLGFGDLNTDLMKAPPSSTAKNMTKILSQYRVTAHTYKTNVDSHTRRQGDQGSYIDYFISIGANLGKVSVGKPIGASDHNVVSCEASHFKPIRRKSRLIFSKGCAGKFLGDLVASDEFERLTKLPALKFFRKLSGRISDRAIMFEPRPKSYFRAIFCIDEEMRSPIVDWGKVTKMIMSCKGIEFEALMGKLVELRHSNEMKEFHFIVGSLLRVRKTAFSANEIENPSGSGEVTYEPEEIRSLISKKYRQLFASDCPRRAFEVGYIEPVTSEEISELTEVISAGKGIGMDCIPDTILGIGDFRIVGKLAELVNLFFESKRIYAPFKFARLHLLNKLRTGIPSLDDLRPIMISSPIIKVIEAIALKDLKEKLEPLIDHAQVGFLPKLSTQTQILRLLGKVIDCKANPRFGSGAWIVLFIDFKAAFDRVDHNILLRKLEVSGIKPRTLNIIRLLYNSYHFTLPGGSPNRVNSGVAQGSLISPILYDWYVNDLVRILSGEFGQDSTYAYADDIAVLCLGNSEARRALSATEAWAATNGAQINKKKCGLLRITKRETSIGIRELEGIPLLHEYKYLGLPLDQSFTLKFLIEMIRRRTKAFVSRVGIIPHSIVGLSVKLNLWQCYARCHFEYYAPAIILCGQLNKFERMYTKSLKRALDLPLQTSNEPLLKALGIPSLLQMAAYHITVNTKTIKKRFQACPGSLDMLAAGLTNQASEYRELQRPTAVVKVEKGTYLVDLLANKSFLDKCYIGLVVGNFLTIRTRGGEAGEIGGIRNCPLCRVPATQTHFLNVCPTNSISREALSQSLPPKFTSTLLQGADYSAFYKNVRSLEVTISGTVDEVDPIPDKVYDALAKAASTLARSFVEDTLSLFKRDDWMPL
jgi:exonuclease III